MNEVCADGRFEIIEKAMELGMVMPETQDDSGNDLFGSSEEATNK